MTGQTLSHFEILEKIGEGGMGIVYKARDTQLGRIVALKLLPAERLADPDRRRRFVQEARAASALNHPNIVTIYEIAQDKGVDFMAMEFVPGQTLDRAIPRKGFGVGEALRCAAQIADALAQAHAAGIVHRDLKPANIMLTPEGRVKVLDFGLAKLTEPAFGKSGPSESKATLTDRDDAPRTEEGSVMGTVAYMSPEQAEGRPIDQRSDVFSFGSVLYEMLTGQRAFQGETKMATLGAVMRGEPKPLAEAASHPVPRELEKLLGRCLRKSVDRRAQHMGDLKLELEELRDESESGTSAPPSTAGGAAGPSPLRRSPWLIPRHGRHGGGGRRLGVDAASQAGADGVPRANA